jgi:hypothetical protein
MMRLDVLVKHLAKFQAFDPLGFEVNTFLDNLEQAEAG